MALLRHGALLPNDWIFVADEAELPDGAPAVVTLARWRKERVALIARAHPVGLRLKNDEPVHDLAADLAGLKLIEIEFPKFTDGRAFSQARQLRDHLGYRGELRAVGAILRDQYLFMVRCGIDTIVLPEGTTPGGYLAALKEFSVWYQPASDDRVSVLALRHRSINRSIGGAAPLVAANVAARPA